MPAAPLNDGRLPDWPERLVATIERHRAAPFAWGAHDCATLFADCVEAVTGADPLAAYRPWDGESAALRALARAGFGSMRDFVDAHFRAVPAVLARRGDLVLPAAAPALMCPAVVTGAEAVSRDLSGWIVAPVAVMACAWRVG